MVAAVVINLGGARAQAPDNQLGQDLFAAQCAVCHGERGRGVDGNGPSLAGVGAASVDFMLRTGRMPLSSPDARMQRQPPQVTPEQRAALVDYVTSLSDEQGPGIPELDLEDPDLAAGRDLFTRNCAACHGPTGAGIAVGRRDIAPALDAADPVEIAEAVRTGPGVMPVFGSDVYEQEDLEAIVAWVLDLRERAIPGGLTVGRSGPVFEGAVAWFLGLGALLVVIYLLGARPRPGGDDPDAT